MMIALPENTFPRSRYQKAGGGSIIAPVIYINVDVRSKSRVEV